MCNRSLIGGFITHCLACNRLLDTGEASRTYKNSNELVGLCNSCIRASKETSYAHQFTLESLQEGATASTYSDNHSGYYYDYHDN